MPPKAINERVGVLEESLAYLQRQIDEQRLLNDQRAEETQRTLNTILARLDLMEAKVNILWVRTHPCTRNVASPIVTAPTMDGGSVLDRGSGKLSPESLSVPPVRPQPVKMDFVDAEKEGSVDIHDMGTIFTTDHWSKSGHCRTAFELLTSVPMVFDELPQLGMQLPAISIMGFLPQEDERGFSPLTFDPGICIKNDPSFAIEESEPDFHLVFLGWSWEKMSLTIAYCWQLYTLWIPVQLHEAVPGKSYNQYVELAQAAFGKKLEDEVVAVNELVGKQKRRRSRKAARIVSKVPDLLLPRVAIVGRPNVGKSALFNRLVGGNRAIVVDEPGVTRDRLYGRSFWGDHQFMVMDTGGVLMISKSRGEIMEELAITTMGMEGISLASREAAVARMPSMIERQAAAAVDESSVIIFLVDALAGLTVADVVIADWLHKVYSNKCIILAVNKCESPRRGSMQTADFWSLGFSPLPISAVSGTGTGTATALILNAGEDYEDLEDKVLLRGVVCYDHFLEKILIRNVFIPGISLGLIIVGLLLYLFNFA